MSSRAGIPTLMLIDNGYFDGFDSYQETLQVTCPAKMICLWDRVKVDCQYHCKQLKSVYMSRVIVK